MKIENNSWRLDRIQIRLLWQIIYTYWSSKPFRKVTNNSNTFFIYWNKDNKVFMKEKNENWDFIFQRHHIKHTTYILFWDFVNNETQLWLIMFLVKKKNVNCVAKSVAQKYLPTLMTPTAANFFDLVIHLWSGVNLLREFLGKIF